MKVEIFLSLMTHLINKCLYKTLFHSVCNSSVRDPNPPGSEFTCRMGIRDTKSGPYLQWFVTVNNHIKFKKTKNIGAKKNFSLFITKCLVSVSLRV